MRLIIVFLGLLAVMPVKAETAAPEKLQSSIGAELRLLRGAFYFHYLNNDYQQSLNALAQWKQYLQHHQGGNTSSESQVMEAAILLALGLQQQAEDLYQTVEQQGGFASGNAWFHLARRWMELGEWKKAENSITNAIKLRPSLNDDYYQQALFIQSSSRSNQDLLSEAKLPLVNMDNDGIWTGLARYNWMLAAMRLNANSRDLEKLIEEATFYLPDSYEGKALADRILLVAGIYALDSGKNRRAEAYFKEISQDSAFTAPGLLHYGWSLVEQWKYQLAMQPWRILQQKYNDFHPAVIESILGVPHALELLNATTQSLKTYEVVEGRLANMLDKLNQLNNDAAINAWLDLWLQQQPHQQWGWMRAELADMPDSDLSRAMQSMLDDADFNYYTANLHDLNRLKSDLAQQANELGLWQTVLTQRQQQLRQAGGEKRLKDLEQRHQQLLRKVLAMQHKVHAEDEKVFAYASSQDEDNIQRLSEVVPGVEYLQKINTPTRDLGIYKERWRRMRGLQLWKVYEEKPERRWDSVQSFWQLRRDSEQLLEQLTNSRLALNWADSSWKGFPDRVRVAQRRVAGLQQQVDAVYAQQRQLMLSHVHQYLDDMKVRLTDYQAQARLSIARLYDDALQNNVAGGGYDDYRQPEPEEETQQQAQQDLQQSPETTEKQTVGPAPEVAGGSDE